MSATRIPVCFHDNGTPTAVVEVTTRRNYDHETVIGLAIHHTSADERTPEASEHVGLTLDEAEAIALDLLARIRAARKLESEAA